MLTAHCIVCNSKVSIADIIDRKCPQCRLFKEPEKKTVIGYTFVGDNITVTVDGVEMKNITHMDTDVMLKIVFAIFPNAHLAEDSIGEMTIHTGIASK